MMLAYNIIATIFLVIASPALLLYAVIFRDNISERIVSYRFFFSRSIWIHSASIGEARAAKIVYEKMKMRFPQVQFVLTAMTRGGVKTLKECVQPPDVALFAPLDHPAFLLHFLRMFNPSLLLIIETEIWSNMIYFSSKRGTKPVLISGKLTKKGERRLRPVRFFIRKLFPMYHMFLMKSNEDAKRIIRLGAPMNKVKVLTSIKFASTRANGEIEPIRHKKRVIVAGSLRKGEFKPIIESFKKIIPSHPNVLLIIAPRHIKNKLEIRFLCERYGLLYAFDSKGEFREDVDVYIVDTYGRLNLFYAIADVAFVGGSLRDFGGHNPLEPASFGVPVIFGPYMRQDAAPLLIECGGAKMIETDEELPDELIRILDSPKVAKRMGEASKRMLAEMTEKVDEYFEILSELVRENYETD